MLEEYKIVTLILINVQIFFEYDEEFEYYIHFFQVVDFLGRFLMLIDFL
jgi:hypothetical protein